ncbi:unnamed protein product, partial [Meganyctiphanes norvegica]
MGEGELSITHFRNTVTSETEKITMTCKSWRELLTTSESLTEEIQGDINVAIGQADLLMKQRFGQFSRLIDQSENKTGEKEITCQDLDGFWFMVYPQVQDVYRKFLRLETLKNNKWVEEEIAAPPTKISVVKKKPVAVLTKPKPLVSGKTGSASSSIRAHMLAAKKKLKEQQEKAQQEKEKITQGSHSTTIHPKKINREFENINQNPNFLKNVCQNILKVHRVKYPSKMKTNSRATASKMASVISAYINIKHMQRIHIDNSTVYFHRKCQTVEVCVGNPNKNTFRTLLIPPV